MEPDERDALVRSLVLEAGRLMEDLSPELAFVLPAAGEQRLDTLAAWAANSTQAAVLLKAAVVLEQHRSPCVLTGAR